MTREDTKKKSIVLLSSGLDSSVNFLVALRRSDVLMALTFDYGQRAAAQEIQHAKNLAQKYQVAHEVVELPWLKSITQTSLVNRNAEVPTNMDIDNVDQTHSTAKSVWVPNRNGVFLNIAASFAESLKAQMVVTGFNKEEAVTFPDNTEDFMDAATNAFSYSTSNEVVVECYTTQMVKTEIASLGRELGLDFNQVWPCYFGAEKICGECESCLRFARATQSITSASRVSEIAETSTYFS